MTREASLRFAPCREGAYSSAMQRLAVALIMLLAFAGLSDNLYLAEHEISGDPLICNIQNLTGCNIVASSKYSHIFGLPVADAGILLFVTLFVLGALELVLFNRVVRRLLQGVALLGLVMSLISAGMQVFVIQALCIYCLVSGTLALIIFLLATGLEPLRRPTVRTHPHETEQSVEKLPMPPA